LQGAGTSRRKRKKKPPGAVTGKGVKKKRQSIGERHHKGKRRRDKGGSTYEVTFFCIGCLKSVGEGGRDQQKNKQVNSTAEKKNANKKNQGSSSHSIYSARCGGTDNKKRMRGRRIV